MARQRVQRSRQGLLGYSSRNGNSNRPLFFGGADPITINRLHEAVTNIQRLANNAYSMQLERYASMDPDRRRDIDDECGYPKWDLSPEEYYRLWMREPIASSVIELFPLECFQVQYEVYEDPDSDTLTPFEQSIVEMKQGLSMEPSYYEGEEGDLVTTALREVDILSGIGRYGVLMLGFSDAIEAEEGGSTNLLVPLHEPVRIGEGLNLVYLNAYPEHLARISQYETRRWHPRYGLPTRYTIWTNDPQESVTTGVSMPGNSYEVHHSRILHVADRWHQTSTSKYLGIPRLRPVLNPVLDIRKIRGAYAEGYWKSNFPILSFETHPQLGGDVDMDFEEIKDMYEEMANGLQRIIASTGFSVNQLEPTVVEAKLDCLYDAIAVKLRVPKRRLLGNEMGDRSTEDDKKMWAGRVGGRCHGHVTPNIIVPFYNRLINVGVLQKPTQGFKVSWPDIGSLTALEQAQVLLARIQSLGVYVSQGCEGVVSPMDYLTKWDNLSDEEALQTLETTMERAEDVEADKTPAALLSMIGGVDAILQMFDRFKEGAIGEETLKQLIMMFYKVDEERAEAIIAEGLPEPPPGSPGDPNMLPPIPPMKGPKAVDGPPSKSPVVQNWLALNIFCATGEGGGIDPSCTAGGGSGPNSEGRYPSKHNPEVTYGNKEDRDADDAYFDREIRKANDKIKSIQQKIAEVEQKHKDELSRSTKDYQDTVAAIEAEGFRLLAEQDKKIEEATKRRDEAKKRVEELKAKLKKGKR